MIPSIEYARGAYAIVPGIAIGSRGPVRSVSLYLRGKLEQIRRVALDTSSRTSVALARILIRERLGRDPEYVDRPPDLTAMLRRGGRRPRHRRSRALRGQRRGAARPR